MSAEEKCNIQPLYTWVDERCVSIGSKSFLQHNCEVGGDSVWTSEGCVSAEDIKSRQQKCFERDGGNRYRWGIDPQSGLPGCILHRTLSASQECREKGNTFYKGRCYPPGNLCDSDKVYTVESECVPRAAEECFNRQDGSQWLDEHCASVAEQLCLANHMQWTAAEKNCSIWDFEHHCDFLAAKRRRGEKLSASDRNIDKTIEGVKVRVGAAGKSCAYAASFLNTEISLDLSQAQIVDLRPLMALEKVEVLDLRENQITDLRPLYPLKKLRILNLAKNKVKNLDGLEHLSGLEVLDLGYNQISSLSPLTHGMPNLSNLDLSGNLLTSVAELGSDQVIAGRLLPRLQYLYLSDNCLLESVNELYDLNLKVLALHNTAVPKESVPEQFRLKDPKSGVAPLRFSKLQPNECPHRLP